MIKPDDRLTENASSLAVLEEAVKYLSDPHHANHKNKILLPARNYNCEGNSPNEFIASILLADERYKSFRSGKRVKRTPALFKEIIYSSQEKIKLTPTERDVIEKLIISRLPINTPLRSAWHIDKTTGREDMHILLSAKTMDYPPKVTLSAQYGGGGKHIYADFTLLTNEITKFLNQNPDRIPAKSLTKARKEKARKYVKKPSLAEEIAQLLKKTKLPLSDASIDILIKKLGYEVKSRSEKFVLVTFRHNGKPRRFNLQKLTEDITLAKSTPTIGKSESLELEIA